MKQPSYVQRLSNSARRGFTLIELLAVILIIGILSAFLLPRIPEVINAAEVTACEKNLQEIYKGLMIHDQKYGDLPQKNGVRFFTSLITREVYPNTKSVAKKMTCPGIKTSALGTIAGLPETEWYAEEDAIDGNSSAYAGRNMKEYGLRKFPGEGFEPLVADDNDGGKNHRTETLVLYDDGTVQRLDNVTLREEGLLGEDEYLWVGPDSQMEELRKLSLD